MPPSFQDKELLFQQKYNNQIQTVQSLTNLNKWLLITYYICIIIAMYFLFAKYEYNIYIKIGLSLLAIAYPFIIYFIEYSIYDLTKYMSALIGGIPVDRI